MNGYTQSGLTVQWNIIQPLKRNKVLVLVHVTAWMNLEMSYVKKKKNRESHICMNPFI